MAAIYSAAGGHPVACIVEASNVFVLGEEISWRFALEL